MEDYFYERCVGVDSSYTPFLDDYLLPVLEIMYPGRYYIDIVRDGNEIDSYTVIIHYPEIDLYNSNRADKIHTIKDLFVKLTFYDDNRGIKVGLQGMRTTFFTGEIHNGYIHSHLGSMPKDRDFLVNTIKWKEFCLGSGEMKSILTKYCVVGHKSYNLLKTLFLQLNSYVAWESIEGTPYKYASNIPASGVAKFVLPSNDYGRLPFHLYFSSFFALFPDLLPEVRISSKGEITVLPQSLSDILTLFLEYLGTQGFRAKDLQKNALTFKCLEKEGKYYKQDASDSLAAQFLNKFRGWNGQLVPITGNISMPIKVLDIDCTDITTYNSIFHPFLMNYFKEELERVLNLNFKTLLNQNKDESRSIDYRIIQRTIPVLVQENQ